MIVCIAAFLLVARRLLRVAVKVAFALTLIFALLLTAGVGWWRGWFEASPRTRATPPAQPHNVNRRATR